MVNSICFNQIWYLWQSQLKLGIERRKNKEKKKKEKKAKQIILSDL